MNMHKVAFLLGGVGISGGINVIFQHGIRLAMKGYQVFFITNKKIYPSDINWHPIYNYIKENDKSNIKWICYNEIGDISFDFAIATWWRTFFDLWKIKAAHYHYFVQSIESRFYSIQEMAVRSVVESTYELNLGFITECKWICSYLQENYNHDVSIALNGIDKNIFNNDGFTNKDRNKERLRVLVEGPVDIPFKNVPATINMVNQSLADEVWLLTSSPVEDVKGVDRVFSKIHMHETPAVYRSCDVIVKLSYVEGMFGPPLEMFHCGGTCVVYDVTGHEEYVINNKNGIVVKTDAESHVIKSINGLKENPNVLKKLKEGALNTAQEWPDWEKSNDMFEEGLITSAGKSSLSYDLLKRYSKRIWHIYENRNR